MVPTGSSHKICLCKLSLGICFPLGHQRLPSPCWAGGDLGRRETYALLLGREAGRPMAPSLALIANCFGAQINACGKVAGVGVLDADPLPSPSVHSWKLFSLFVFSSWAYVAKWTQKLMKDPTPTPTPTMGTPSCSRCCP